MIAISFNNISKKYEIGLRLGSLRDNIPMMLKGLVGKRPKRDSIWAVKDLSFEVKKGEALGIIGPNGAGKTTVLKLLSNVTKQTSGTIVTEGMVSALIELGAGFHPDLTGRENVYLNGSILGLTKKEIDKKFDEIVAFSEIEKFIDTPVKYYSSGMYLRLGFSVAVHVNPDILLIDEVLAVGDMAFRRKCLSRMDDLRNNRDATIVFVSHDLWSVEAVCKDAVFLLDGRIVARGKVKDVITAYQSYDIEKMKKIREKVEVSAHQDELLIPAVRLIDGDGKELNTFLSGEKVTVRVYYFALKRIDNPILVISVERLDGLVCLTVRTRHSKVVLNNIEGEGFLEAEFESLSLNSGLYKIHALIKDSRDLTVYARSTESFRIYTEQVSFGENTGIYFPKVQWRQKTV